MVYRLNYRDDEDGLRSQLKTYQQPRTVATTPRAQPIQQKPVASTSNYSVKQRDDGGFDFFRGNEKTNVDEYVKNTGVDKNQLVSAIVGVGNMVTSTD